MPCKVNGHRLMADEEHLKPASLDDLGIQFQLQAERDPTEEEQRRLDLCRTLLDQYLLDNFVMPTTLSMNREVDEMFGCNCICCGTVHTGGAGSFTWADGDDPSEGYGYCGRCGWPGKANHTLDDPENPGNTFIAINNMVLQYRPEKVGHSKKASVRVHAVENGQKAH